MFATTSPTMHPRRVSAGSFDSNPDADVEDDENGNDFDNAGAGGGLRPPSPHPMAYPRPPRESFVRQSLTVPEPPRESFIPYSAFAYREPQQRVSRDLSYVDVDENMEIDPHYGHQNMNDEEFARRGNSTPRPGRLRRLAHALLRPFRAVKLAIRFPKFLRSKRAAAQRPVTQSSGWDFRDPTPAPPSIRMQLSHDEADRAPENATVLFPQPSTAPVTMLEVGADQRRDHQSEDSSSEDSDSDHGRSMSHRSHFSGRSPSHRSAQPHGETNKVNHDVLRASATTRTSFAPLSPAAVPASTFKELSRARSSRTYSSASHGSSLLHHVVRMYHGLLALYHLPWIAAPPKRVAVDFIPALGSRSKYCVHRGPPQVPPAVRIAAAAAKNMEPSDGKSWYHPSPQQMEKQQRRGKGTNRHQHSHPHSFANPYQQQYLADPRAQQRQNGQTDGQPIYMYNPTVPPFPPQCSPYGAQQFYMVPGPPPTHGSSPVAGAGGGGLRAPAAARPPSVMSFSLPSSRPGPRPVQNPPGQVQNTSPDSNSPGRSDIQRPPPAVQPMYMIVQAPPGPPLPPSYGNVYPYPYSPPWTPPQRV